MNERQNSESLVKTLIFLSGLRLISSCLAVIIMFAKAWLEPATSDQCPMIFVSVFQR